MARINMVDSLDTGLLYRDSEELSALIEWKNMWIAPYLCRLICL